MCNICKQTMYQPMEFHLAHKLLVAWPSAPTIGSVECLWFMPNIFFAADRNGDLNDFA